MPSDYGRQVHHLREVNDDLAQGSSPADISLGTRRSRRDWIARRALAASDCLALAASGSAVLLLSRGGADPANLAFLVLMSPIWVISFRAYGLYDMEIRKVGRDSLDEVVPVFHGVLISTLLLALIAEIVGEGPTLSELFCFGFLANVLVLATRRLLRVGLVGIFGPERTLIIGGAGAMPQLIRALEQHPRYGLAPVGCVSQSSPGPGGLPILGMEAADVEAVIDAHAIEHVIASSNDDLGGVDLLERCRREGVKVSVLPSFSDAMGPGVVLGDVNGITVMNLTPLVLSRSSRAAKRALDLVGAGALIVIMLPAAGLIALLIKLDSRGPVVFAQERCGQNGRHFRIYKFRTMVADAEHQRETLLARSVNRNWLHVLDDPRVTRVGRLLRRTSLDELPQLINVLKGDMSLVGPRPLIPAEHHNVRGWQTARLDLRPGVTGPWQVLGRTAIPFEEMVKLDYLYVTNWSLWRDIRLLVQTLPAVLSQRGAN